MPETSVSVTQHRDDKFVLSFSANTRNCILRDLVGLNVYLKMSEIPNNAQLSESRDVVVMLFNIAHLVVVEQGDSKLMCELASCRVWR